MGGRGAFLVDGKEKGSFMRRGKGKDMRVVFCFGNNKDK